MPLFSMQGREVGVGRRGEDVVLHLVGLVEVKETESRVDARFWCSGDGRDVLAQTGVLGYAEKHGHRAP